jgi:predicted  nucleic acid-binding Zn-ribbon protein
VEVSAGQILAIVAQGALLAVSGIVGLLVRGTNQRLDKVSDALDDVRSELAEVRAGLARGDQRFDDLERRVGVIEGRLDKLQDRTAVGR